MCIDFGERERNIDVREKHQLVAFCTCLEEGSNLQPRHAPWPGIKLATFRLHGMMLQPTEPPSQGPGTLHYEVTLVT